MARNFAIALFALLGCAACGPLGSSPLDWISGVRHSDVVLASTPFELNSEPRVFTPAPGAASVVGGTTDVCLVLAGDVDSKDATRRGDELLNGAKPSAVVTTTDGKTHELKSVGNAWSKNGMLKRNEVAACMIVDCDCEPMKVGAAISSIAISSDLHVHALGAYWSSTNAWDENRR